MTEYEYEDQIPVPSILIGGPHDGAVLELPYVNVFYNHYPDGDLLLNAYYHHDRTPDSEGRVRYLFDRIEPAAVVYDEEPA